jgi:hypothetical protein
MEPDPAVGERPELVLARRGSGRTIQITDIRRDPTLEVACRNHPVPSIVSTPAEDKHAAGILLCDAVCK